MHLNTQFKTFQLSDLQIIIEAVPKDEVDQARKYRGYIAIDEIKFETGDMCHGHCTFDAGFCAFENVDDEDDFDWSVVSQRLPPLNTLF